VQLSDCAFERDRIGPMNQKRPSRDPLTMEQSDLAVCFYDEANDHPKETFEQIAKRVVPRGFGESRTSLTFRKEAGKLFNLVRSPTSAWA
jgi:hypothetical protein